MHHLRVSFPLLVMLGLVLAAGCKKTAPAPTAGGPSVNPGAAGQPAAIDDDPSDKYAGAKATFRAQCARCHSTSPPGEGAKMRGGRGPNLAKVGADPKHTKAWLSEHIRDPQVQTPESRMPKFQGRIKDDDLKHLVDYLASLK